MRLQSDKCLVNSMFSEVERVFAHNFMPPQRTPSSVCSTLPPQSWIVAATTSFSGQAIRYVVFQRWAKSEKKSDTKTSRTRTADAIIAYTTGSGLSPGLWYDRILYLEGLDDEQAARATVRVHLVVSKCLTKCSGCRRCARGRSADGLPGTARRYYQVASSPQPGRRK